MPCARHGPDLGCPHTGDLLAITYLVRLASREVPKSNEVGTAVPMAWYGWRPCGISSASLCAYAHREGSPLLGTLHDSLGDGWRETEP